MNAIDALVADLRAKGDHSQLFYALLLKARVALGVSPFPSGPSAELPESAHEPYEAAIREAAREVGALLLAQKDLPRAWGYFRLIGEPQPVKDALDAIVPDPDDDVYPLLDIAWHQRVHPHRGFDLLLERHGLCSAITTISSSDLSHDPALRLACVRKLISALHEQLLDRLQNDHVARGLTLPSPPTIPQMLRDELFADDAYHIDVSHLSSVVQMSLELPPGDGALKPARDLAEYGRKLAPGLRGRGEAPFEETYDDFARFLDVLDGTAVDAGLAHFESKIAPELADGNTFPAEVLVNLLIKIDRRGDALVIVKKYLADLPTDAELSCPTMIELARQAGDYAAVADAARAKGDAVTELAARLAAGRDV